MFFHRFSLMCDKKSIILLPETDDKPEDKIELLTKKEKAEYEKISRSWGRGMFGTGFCFL